MISGDQRLLAFPLSHASLTAPGESAAMPPAPFPAAEEVGFGPRSSPTIAANSSASTDGQAMTPQEFIAKWRAVTLSERSACQQHFLDLCELLGQPKPA